MSDNKKYDFRFTWKIVNYSSCFQEYDMFIKSPQYTVDCLDNSKWTLELYPHGCDEFPKNQVSLSLTRGDDSAREEIEFEDRLEIMTIDGEIIQSCENEKDVYRKLDTYYFTEIVCSVENLENEIKYSTQDVLIIRHYMKTLGRNDLKNQDCEAITEIGVDRYSIKWNVNIFNIPKHTECKDFLFPKESPIKLTLTSEGDDILISLSMSQCFSSTFIKCKLSLIDIEEKEQDYKIDSYLFVCYEESEDEDKETEDEWKFPNFLKISQLKNKEALIVIDGYFVLLCELSVSNSILREGIVEDKSLRNLISWQNDDAIDSLCSDFTNMFQNKKHADVRLRIGREEILVHKFILVARSPVFSTMFDQDMIETREGVIDIEDMDTKTLHAFLNFMYAGKVSELDYELASELLVAAEKYQVETLKQICTTFLKSSFTETNVCQTLLLADMMGHNLLKKLAMNYIKKNSHKIMHSIEWFQLIENNTKLGSEVLQKISSELRHSLIFSDN